ncbi:MAG: 6-phosphogluconolactonase [Planctomycetes bacterium]|nr:6-phosphogluconolactonase [Planctomycetota bacterium]
MIDKPTVRVCPHAAAVAQALVELFVESAAAAIEARHSFHVCLAGGSTPRAAYSLLAAQAERVVAWEKVHVYFGDERCVPPEHAESNYRMVNEALLSRVGVRSENVHRMRAELGAVAAATEYEQELRRQLAPQDGRFDLVVLGMGDDAHTASLFPHTGALHVQDRWCVGHFVPRLGAERVTLTYPIINAARRIVFLVTGAGKAETLRAVFSEPYDASERPAQGMKPTDGELIWLVDQAAATELPPELVTS